MNSLKFLIIPSQNSSWFFENSKIIAYVTLWRDKEEKPHLGSVAWFASPEKAVEDKLGENVDCYNLYNMVAFIDYNSFGVGVGSCWFVHSWGK